MRADHDYAITKVRLSHLAHMLSQRTADRQKTPEALEKESKERDGAKDRDLLAFRLLMCQFIQEL